MSRRRVGLNKLLIFGVAVAVLAVGTLATLRGNEGEHTSVPAAKASGSMSLGSPDAPIVVVEYSDFQCPYCGIFARDIQPRLIEEFVDAGLVRFEWRNFPIFGEFSTLAAHGAFCADEQHAFWPYHDAVYAAIGSLSQREKNIDTLVNIASSLDLDATAFRACMEEGRHLAQVAADYEEGRALGILGTPSFTINGVLMVGAQPIETWRNVFDALGPGH